MGQESLFFQVVSVSEAQRLLLEAFPEPRIPWEEVCLPEAVGRVLARELVAGEDVPACPRSTVDGYAVRAVDTFGASESLPAYLDLGEEVAMGRPAPGALRAGQCCPVPTGGMLPEGADAVVMVEHAELPGDGTVAVLRPVAPGENLIWPGEDVGRGQVVLPPGRVLRPPDVGVAAALGFARLPVFRRLRVAILSTGDELVPPDRVPEPGRVRDVNSYTLAAAVRNDGWEAELLGIAPDRPAALEEALREGMRGDALLVSGGSSVGARDLVAQAISRLGNPGILVHGVALRPGKPVIAAVADGRPVFGLPGHPVSALVVYYLLARPVLRRLAGSDPFPLQPTVRARLARSLSSRPGLEEYVRVSLRMAGDGLRAEPVLGKSGLISTLARAWGLVRIPPEATGLEQGEEVEVIPIAPW